MVNRKVIGGVAAALSFIMMMVMAGCDMMNTEAVSSDANLAGITVSSGTLSPGFLPDIDSYTVSVDNTVESITVNATAAHPKAAVSNSAETGKALSYGSNDISITVTAEDGTKKTYTVTVTRNEGEAGDGSTAPRRLPVCSNDRTWFHPLLEASPPSGKENIPRTFAVYKLRSPV
jgi:imidazole glycerol phosphate synthase subunit HisF